MKKFLFLLWLICFIPFVKAEELPKLYFEGNISKMTSKADERKITFKYEDDNIKYEGYANLKIQGTSSIAYAKKNYTIKFYEDEKLENKLKIDFGWGKQNKYCLKANWIDKTHARNIVAAKIASKIQAKYNLFNNTPNHGLIDGYPIEIYINGDFLGLYTLNIPKDAWMFNMDEDNPNHIVLVGDKWSSSVFFQKEATWDGSWKVEVGKENEETLEKLNRLIKFVKDSTDTEFKENINEYLNLDALINYYIISEYFYLPDNLGKNMLLVTYDGKVWYTSLYDLDTSFGTSSNGKETFNANNLVMTDVENNLFLKLIKNFKEEIANRYFTLREEYLNVDYIMQEFKTFSKSIPYDTLKKETSRWQNIPGYGIEQIENFLTERTPIIDEYITKFYPNGIKPEQIIEETTFDNSKNGFKDSIKKYLPLLGIVGVLATIVVFFNKPKRKRR